MTEATLRTSRRIFWGAIALQVLGIAWDGWWHSRHPGALEAGWALLEAHGLMYGGILLAGIGALWAFRSDRRPGPVSWYALGGYGALAQAVGTAWDVWGHAMGGEVALAHALSRFGLLLLLGSVAAATLEARRSRPAAEDGA